VKAPRRLSSATIARTLMQLTLTISARAHSPESMGLMFSSTS
jgi:hypothetical protein